MAAKETKIIAISTCIGAIVNIIFNVLLISLLGPLGAAISTMFSSIVIWAIRVIEVKKIVNFNIKLKKDLLIYFIIIIQGILALIELNNYLFYSLELICLIIICILYKEGITILIRRFKNLMEYKQRNKKNYKKK